MYVALLYVMSVHVRVARRIADVCEEIEMSALHVVGDVVVDGVANAAAEFVKASASDIESFAMNDDGIAENPARLDGRVIPNGMFESFSVV